MPLSPPVTVSEQTAAPAAEQARGQDVPALAFWHAGWALACGLLVLVGQWVSAPIEGAIAFGVLAMAWPGLVGLLLLLQDGTRERLWLLGTWTLAALGAAALTGGLTGPLGGFALMPLAAGVATGGHRRAQMGIVGVLVVVASGLVAALTGAPPMTMPTLSALATTMSLIALAVAMRLSWRVRDRRLGRAEDAVGRVEGLLTALPTLTLVLDPSGRVLAAYGSPPPGTPIDPLFEQGLIAAVHAPDRPAVLSALDKAIAGAVAAQVDFTPRVALDRRAVMVVRRLDPEGGPGARLVAQIYDASAAYARELALDAARAEAAAQNAGKSRFLANMSHELRTPLNAVLGFSDIMRQKLFGPLPEKYADYARSIHEAGGHLLDLINDVLDVSKIEADRYELSRETLDAREAVSAAMTLVRLGADEKGVGLNGVLPADPVSVTADRRALKQMTLNLLSNAIKFTPAGGSVTVSLDVIGPYVEITVADTGVGIAPEDMKRLGRPFEQAGGADQKAQGTGLGLSLVRSLAELHGGRMIIESTLGEGTAITLRLPIITLVSPGGAGGGDVVPLRPAMAVDA